MAQKRTRKRKGRKKRQTKRQLRLYSRIRFICAAVLLASCPILMALFRQSPESFFPVYREGTKQLATILGAINAWCPIAVWDWLIAYAVVMALVTLIRHLWNKELVRGWASWVVLVTSMLIACAVDGWALNHYAPTLASEMGFSVQEYSTNQLAETTSYYLDQAAQRADSVRRDKDGTLQQQDFFQLAKAAGSSYQKLSKQYPIFQGPTTPVKALILFGKPLLYSGHTGIYWADSGEASVPIDDANAEIEFDMCHEVAHRLGIAREEEANFASFVACTTSEDDHFVYSGYFSAFNYCFNALCREDPNLAQQVMQTALEQNEDGVMLVVHDRQETQKHYQQFQGPFENVGTTVNDSYLSSFGERGGIRSYGLVVDDLIAWHEAGN